MVNSVDRLLDANVDRIVEGLRVVGEVLRFVAEDAKLTGAVRTLRRDVVAVVHSVPHMRERRVSARDSVTDVGRSLPSSPYRDLVDLIEANWSRVQESLRTLEEIGRACYPGWAERLAPLRYEAYTLEKHTVTAMQPFIVRSRLDFGLYVVLGQAQQKGRDFETVTRAAIAGGAGAIQLRAKELGKRDILEWAKRLRAITAESGTTFLINDHLDIAMACEADGVHLGQNDLPIADARRIVGPNIILGASTHSVEEALEAETQGASYINVGPIFPTQTKAVSVPPVGPGLLREIRVRVQTPLTCMGGIGVKNIGQVLDAGAERVAVVSAVVGAEEIEAAARQLSDTIEAAQKRRSGTESPTRP